jgi:LuxR family maltose regulon positive regulatory protein
MVLRQRLLQKLNQGLDCGFVLVSAPAGYGKSTILSAWLSRAEFPSVWLSLDERDNDLNRFLTYLTAAFQRLDPSINEESEFLVGFSQQVEVEAYLTTLINHLSQLRNPTCLILDDFHEIQNQLVHQAVNFLLIHHPPSLRLVIATRADPPLSLAKLRARSCMVEIRMADLRFTTEEATEFLNRTMGLKISPEDVARVTSRTEGWIAGLQMAALSMQNSDDISAFITNLSGSHHYIFDYLLEEILGKQSTEVQRFLTHTSILDQLCAPLCDAMLEGDAGPTSSRISSVIIEELEHANLFIIPLDQKQYWYRYHPLFAELLRGYLQKNDPTLLPVLHIRASIWLEGQGMVAEAIKHSFVAGDWERVARLISSNIFALLEQNELNNVARQLETLTSDSSPARPWLLIGRAWLAAYTGQLSSAEDILKLAESQIDFLRSEHELQTLGGHIAVIRAYINWILDRREIAFEAASVALEWLPLDEYTIRCQAATMLGLAHRELVGSAQALELALDYARKCSVSHVTIFAHGCWAWLLAMQGRLHASHAACLEAIQVAQSNKSQQPLPTLSHVYSTLSFVLCEWNDMEGALRYSKEAVSLARRWEQADALHFALDNYGLALFAAGDVDGAFDILHQARQVAQRTSDWFENITLMREVEWYLDMGNLEAAKGCFQRAQVDIEAISPDVLKPQKSRFLIFSIVEILLTQKQFSKALALANQLAEDQENKGIEYYFIRALILESLAYHGLKQEDQALASLKRALVLAAPEGYIRTFLRGGTETLFLLQQAAARGIVPDYVDRLLATSAEDKKEHRVEVDKISGLVEPLSEREMDVLKLLAQGCSDKKIAETLVIARETVHKHLKNIYGKLDVHSRTEAVARARQLKLL